MNSTVFISEPSSVLEVTVVIFWLESMFLRKENWFNRLVLKIKQQKAIQLLFVFIKLF